MRPLRLLWLAALGGGIAWGIRTYVAEPIFIPTASMEPSLPVGTHAFLDKVILRLRDPERGDILVFRSPVDAQKELVKRVIGLPGETVELRQKRVWVNGRPLQEPYAQYTRLQERLKGDNLEPVVVSERSVFVLGDNRDESKDSSVWTDPETGQRIYFIPYSSIRGVVRGFFKRS